jgi:hypothetical protein
MSCPNVTGLQIPDTSGSRVYRRRVQDELIEIGFWAGPDATDQLPNVEAFIDPDWDGEIREFIAGYLGMGQIAMSYMGYSSCRICGDDNGDLELTDGVYVWPSGLTHYVSEHDVRLPEQFVSHAISRLERIEQAPRERDWWREAEPDTGP